MTGFMAAFLESLEMEDWICVSRLHTEGVKKKETDLVAWLSSLKQEIVLGKVVEKVCK